MKKVELQIGDTVTHPNYPYVYGKVDKIVNQFAYVIFAYPHRTFRERFKTKNLRKIMNTD